MKEQVHTTYMVENIYAGKNHYKFNFQNQKFFYKKI